MYTFNNLQKWGNGWSVVPRMLAKDYAKGRLAPGAVCANPPVLLSDDKSNNKPPVEQVLVLEGNVDVGQIKDLLNILDGLSSDTSKAEKLEIKKSESGGGGDAATSEGKQESSTGGNGDESGTGTGTKRSPDGKAQLKSLDVATNNDVDEPSAKKRKEV